MYSSSPIGGRIRAKRTALGISQKALADRAGVSQGLIGQIESGINKGSKHIIAIASALGVTPEWLESGHEFSVRESQVEYLGSAPPTTRIPVAGIAQLGENGWYAEIAADGSEGYVEHHTRDPGAYVLRVRGDSMHPAIRNGWYVVVEPSMCLCGGMYVAVALLNGKKMVKELLYETATDYALQSVNGGERLSVNRDDVISIHGVAAVVAPGKHRD